ncbi:MAG: glycosyltransferase family 4 protein [Bdellovibrionales bacterium]|nr:glycosyltransferase family 4 protein [Bdellovibrionales bacterium]
MRIALVSEFFYPTLGGMQEHLYNIAREFEAAGHPTSIVTPKILNSGDFKTWWPKGLPERSYRPVGVSLPIFMNGSVARLTVGWRLAHKLEKLLSKDNFDIVHLHSPLFGTMPLIANRASKLPIVGTFHTSFPDSINLQVFKLPAQRHIDRLSRVIAVSPVSLSSINRFLDVEADIIPNGVDTKQFRPVWEGTDDRIPALRDGKINVLFIGRPEPRNGLDTLLRAFMGIYKEVPEARLVIAGGGDQMPKYQAMVKDMPKDAVRFLGPVLKERPELYRTADIHVFGVEKATFSITVLEGLASGLPVLTTDFIGHRDLGEPGKHFLTTPFGDDAALGKELVRLIRDKAAREKLGHAAREHALNFDWAIVARKILNVYEAVLSAQE